MNNCIVEGVVVEVAKNGKDFVVRNENEYGTAYICCTMPKKKLKDSMGDMMVVSFEQMNAPLAVLCTLGGLALLIGIVAAFCRKEKINKILFYSLSLIIVAKTIIVEVLRIASYFNSL